MPESVARPAESVRSTATTPSPVPPAAARRSARSIWAASWRSLCISMALIGALVVVVVVVTPRPGAVELPTVAVDVKAADMATRQRVPVAVLTGQGQWRATSIDGKAATGAAMATWRVGYHRSGGGEPAFFGIEQFRGRDAAEVSAWLSEKAPEEGGDIVTAGPRQWRVSGKGTTWTAVATAPVQGLTTVVRSKGLSREETVALLTSVAPVSASAAAPVKSQG